jgi:O-antigen/teichoic acid export membrane protein
VGFYVIVVLLTTILGAHGVGGLRAADAVFAPFTLLAPALMLAGLPAVARQLASSREDALKLAAGISVASIAATGVYAALMLVFGPRLITLVFGRSFESYADLLLPVSVQQFVLAAGIGFAIFLRAEQRGRAIVVTGVAMVITSLVGSTTLASLAGPSGAVWGLCIGAAVASTLSGYFALRPSWARHDVTVR